MTTSRAAAAAATLAVLADALPPLLGMYATVVAAAGLLGAAFVAYLALVDRPGILTAAQSAACAAAGLLVLVDAALRFPAVLAGGGPPAAALLARASLGLVLAAALAPLPVMAARTAMGRRAGEATREADETPAARSARRWRRLVGAH